MTQMLRVVLTAATAIAAFFFTFWIGGVVLDLFGLPVWPIIAIAPVVAIVAGRFVWRGSDSPGLMQSVAEGGVLVGAIGFIGGFFGPLILAPDANQGPLLGLFITGPLGAVIGAVGGGVRWFARHGAEARAAHAARAHPSATIGRDPTTAVLAVHARWIAFEREGSPLRVLELCREDVVWRPPGDAPIEGREAVRAWLRAQPPQQVQRLDISDLRVDVSGDVAVKQAAFQTQLRLVGETQVRDVQGTHVWTLRRQGDDASWLVTDVRWTFDAASAPGRESEPSRRA